MLNISMAAPTTPFSDLIGAAIGVTGFPETLLMTAAPTFLSPASAFWI